MAGSSFRAFCDALDALVDKFREDGYIITRAEVVGALIFKAHAIMVEADEGYDEEEAP